MKSTSLITCDYQGHAITLTADGWFDATTAAAKFDKKPAKWLESTDAQRYLASLAKFLNVRKTDLYKTKPGRFGGGTWMHPKLAVAFARWLDDDFAVWCDMQIDEIIKAKQQWGHQRHLAASSAKLLAASIKDAQADKGKEAKEHHYSNEHMLVNSLLTGKREGLNRETLPTWQLDFLSHFDLRDSLLVLKNIAYQDRKAMLQTEAKAWMTANQHRIGPANDAGKLAA